MFWDRVAGVYDLFVNVVNRKTHKALRRIVAELIGPEDRVLECACGTGLLTEVIAGKCKALTASDFAPKMLKRAEKNCAAYQRSLYRICRQSSLPLFSLLACSLASCQLLYVTVFEGYPVYDEKLLSNLVVHRW